jgi:hypothetical protein
LKAIPSIDAQILGPPHRRGETVWGLFCSDFSWVEPTQEEKNICLVFDHH